MTQSQIEYLKSSITNVPDYPKPGIMFKDITGLLKNHEAFSLCIKLLAEHYQKANLTKIVAIEARGFFFGSALAYELGIGMVPVRKPNKLPLATYSQTYQLEYGTDTLEIHQDALTNKDRVLIIDDLIATGGSISATIELVKQTQAKIIGTAFIIDLPELGGSEKIKSMNIPVFSLIQY